MQLNSTNAIAYLKSRGIHARKVTELGGGISNIVLRVETEEGSAFVLKQSLPQLRVKDRWEADRSRIFRETESLRDAAAFLPPNSSPAVLWSDEENYAFAMSAVGGLCWKDELMAGRLEPAVAAKAGALLACLIGRSWKSETLQEKYGDLRAFEQLRIAPYYRTIAERHSDVRAQVSYVIQEMSHRRLCLCHGDFSPKNILIEDGRLILIDFEVVHFGDPAFDAAFCLSLLLVGWFYQPKLARQREELAQAFFNALRRDLPKQTMDLLEKPTLRHLGCLMLARIDGKSPVEYLPEESIQDEVRTLAKGLILDCPDTFEECMERIFNDDVGRSFQLEPQEQV